MVQPELRGIVIVCPHCGTRYQVSAEAIGSGRLVQCANCLQSWTATMPGGTAFTPPAPESDALFDAAAEAELDASFEAEERRSTRIAAVPAATPPRPPAVPPAPPTANGTAKKEPSDKGGRRRPVRRVLPIDRLRRTARLAGILILLALVGGGLVFRTEIVRQVPDLAGFYQVLGLGVNVIGLEFRDVHTLKTLREGVEVLTVDARIIGISTRRAVVPPVVVTLLGANGRPLYEWSVTPPARDLEAGEAVSFSTTLTDPPKGAETVRLTFTNGRARTEMPIAFSAQPLESPR